MEPEFLSFEQVMRAHRRSLEAYGGIDGIRDEATLLSAIDQPKNDFYYGGAELFGIAAAYAFHIAQSQAFLDGNKRTAIASALGFLELNGVPTRTATAELYAAMIAIAEHRLDKAGLAALFRQLFA